MQQFVKVSDSAVNVHMMTNDVNFDANFALVSGYYVHC